MKQSKILIRTLRGVPNDADVVSQRLMIRSGMLQKLAAGVYSYLPLLFRSIRKVESIIREELDKDGCQELLMPVVQPSGLWYESGRWHFYGKELLRFQDRKNADFCLGPTHEEVITDIVRNHVTSYKQLPVNLFQIQTKFRDEIRPRFGLMRGREFIMKDGYSFDVDDISADKTYWQMFDAYKRIFTRLGVRFCCVEADSGNIGGNFTHEFHVLAGAGEDILLSCDKCGYVSNIDKAEVRPLVIGDETNNRMPLKLSHFNTPNIINTEAQAKAFVDEIYNGLPLFRVSKVYWLEATISDISKQPKLIVAAVLRGDHKINIQKVKNYLKATEVTYMRDAEEFVGAETGFLGPIPKKGTQHWNLHGSDKLIYIVDQNLEDVGGLTCGANVIGEHHFGFNPKRDLPNANFVDISMAQAGALCARCGNGNYRLSRGIEVGQIFKLGTKYSKLMDCMFLDDTGKERYMVMGCYGIGITRTISAIIEQNYDEDGIMWPWPVAPYQIHLLDLDPDNQDVFEVSNSIELELEDAGFEVIHDDISGVSPGVKFKNADLLGFPLRITVGAKDLKNNVVDLYDRRTKESSKVCIDNILSQVSILRDKIIKRMVEHNSNHNFS